MIEARVAAIKTSPAAGKIRQKVVWLAIPLWLLTAGQVAYTHHRFDASAYIDEAIAIVRGNGLFADCVDWLKVTAELHRKGDAAATPLDTYPPAR